MKGIPIKKSILTLFISISLIFVISVISVSGSGPVEGEIWTFNPMDTLYDIVYLNEKKAVIVGSQGKILVSHSKYNNLWSPRDSKVWEGFTCLSFIDEKMGLAGGHGGIIIRTMDGGETWKIVRESSLQSQPILDIELVSENVAYACGGYDLMIKSVDGGNTWNDIPTGETIIYGGMDFINEKVGFIVGEFGTVMKTLNGGKTWIKKRIGNYKGSMFGVTVLSPGKILTYGVRGALYMSRDGGNSWENKSVDVEKGLFRAAYKGNDIVIVGSVGIMLISRDGGKTFTLENHPNLVYLSGVCAHPEGGFMCVGQAGTIYRIEK